MNEQEKREYAKKTVADFTRQFWHDMAWRAGQVIPGAGLPDLPYDSDDELFRRTMEPQEWLTMALYGLGLLPNEDPAEVYEICQGMAEWLFSIPGMSRYDIPAIWYDCPMGALWAAAFVQVQGDELITIAEAARLAGVSVQAISQRIDRGTLTAYTNPDATNPQKERRLVRKSDITA